MSVIIEVTRGFFGVSGVPQPYNVFVWSSQTQMNSVELVWTLPNHKKFLWSSLGFILDFELRCLNFEL